MNLRRDRGPALYQGKDEKVREGSAFRSFSSCFRSGGVHLLRVPSVLLILDPKYRPFFCFTCINLLGKPYLLTTCSRRGV